MIRTYNISDHALTNLFLICDEKGQAKSAVLTSIDNHLYLFSMEYGNLVGRYPLHEDAITGLVWWSMDASTARFATSSINSTIRFWSWSDFNDEPSAPRLLVSLDADSPVTSLCKASTNGDSVHAVVAALQDGSLVCWQEDGRERWRWPGSLPDQGLPLVKADTSSQTFIHFIQHTNESEAKGRFMRVFESDQGRELHLFRLTEPISAVSFLQNGQFICTGSSKGVVTCWRLNESQPHVTWSSGSGTFFRIEVFCECQYIDNQIIGLMQVGDILILAQTNGTISLISLDAKSS